MKIKKQSTGYIMIFTLMLIALLTVLVSYLANRSTPYLSFINIVVQRKKAKLLGLGGIQMAMSQLASAESEKKKTAVPKEKEEKEKEKSEEQGKRLLQAILPSINRWQTVVLDEEKDGIEGKISFAITCEEGKIDINQIYDFESKKFVGEGEPEDDYKKIIQEFFAIVEKKIGGQKLFDALATFLKNRDYKLNDVTELLTIKAFEVFKNNIFYVPPQPEKEQPDRQQKATVYLTDIFTVWSGSKTVEPWLLSNSMCGLLNLEQAQAGDVEKRKSAVKKWLAAFKQTAKWDEDWDKMLEPVYGKNFNTIPKFIKPILSTKFGPTVFSVLSYGKVGEVTQRFLAIIEKEKPEQNGRAIVKLKKLYWL
ncbi:hypothetical protein E3J79_03855 [Candidatus Dependentiae bacterium]|nr:MAG: hypothetical protein E3J79_03855 [Candidatus Dependentiae bacterium]